MANSGRASGSGCEDDRVAFWTDRYARNQLGWHRTSVNDNLQRYYSGLCPKTPMDILVPLCGKSLDLQWLYEQGHNVVGIEAVEKAILEFFAERHLSYNVVTLQPTGVKVYMTPNERLKIYMCDIMEVTPALCGTFDAVWDRGALVAVYENDFERYVAVILGLLKEEFYYLLSAIEYESTTFSGPPRVTTREMIDHLYGAVCNIKFLHTNTGVHSLAGPIEEKLYFLTRKSE